VIGVDSGPLHACCFTQTPSVGIWMPGHYSATYTLPSRQQLNIVLADHTHQWNRYKRIPWNLVEYPGSVFQPDLLAEQCLKVLKPPRYLAGNQPHFPPLARGGQGGSLCLPARSNATNDVVAELARVQTNASNLNSGEFSYRAPHIAANVQLQQFIQDWCRGKTGNALSGFADRHRSFSILFQEISRRFEVEKGEVKKRDAALLSANQSIKSCVPCAFDPLCFRSDVADNSRATRHADIAVKTSSAW
jgi:hypothetical protein